MSRDNPTIDALPLELHGWQNASDKPQGRKEHVVRQYTAPGADGPSTKPASGMIDDFVREYDAKRAAEGKPPACPDYVIEAARNVGYGAGSRAFPARVIKEAVAQVRSMPSAPPVSAGHTRIAAAAPARTTGSMSTSSAPARGMTPFLRR